MTVEVAFLLVLLVVPLFYLVGTLGRLQAGAYAVTAAAREAGRTFATAEDLDSATARADAAANLALGAHGFAPEDAAVHLGCGAGTCLSPGSTVIVDAELAVPLPLVPDFMRSAVPTTITLTAQHVEPVDAFREGR
ncbi:pilus assembly protein [Ornithinimicrobium sufpigmenti]|uniref:pilus assembly protein n=1 Tax=Ornithinimicrobium sufpigmenti TaxID=2508882 RepID=UPI001EDDD562|nr:MULTISPECIES: pilus assembly protein [unclassified Ornithinimicrobium]